MKSFMKGSKLLLTLDLLSRSELEFLDLYLQSPYLISEKTPKEIYPLFRYLMSYYPNWEHPNLEKQIVYKHIFPKKKFTLGKFDKIMSTLLHQIHEFIGIHFDSKKQNKIPQKLTVLQFFRQRNADNFHRHYLQKIQKLHSKNTIRDKDYFFNSNLINEEIFRSELISSKNIESLNNAGSNNSLDIYYVLYKLELACSLLVIDRFHKPINTESIVQQINDLKPICDDLGILETPLIAIYYRAFEMFKNLGTSDTNYLELKELINKNKKLLSKKFLKELNSLIRTFLIHQINHGGKHLFPESFLLYKEHLENGYLDYEEGILPSVLKNLVFLGLQVKEFKWVYDFLNEYKGKIKGTKYPEDVYQFNLASYYFVQHKYDEALELLVDKYDDIFYKISAKRMELKIYYEIKSPILFSKIDAFKVYIFRLSKREIHDTIRRHNNNFVNSLRQTSNPKTAIDPNRIKRLTLKIKGSKYLSEKDWLLEKLAELN